MIFLMLFLILSIVFGLFWYKSAKKGNDIMPLSMVFCFLSICLTIVIVILLIINHINVHKEIAEYYAVKQTIENARATDVTNIEQAALSLKIVEMNKWMAGIKYSNGIILFDDFIPDEVNKLEPLR